MEFALDKFRKLYDMFDDIDDETVLLIADSALLHLSKCAQKIGDLAWFLMVAHMLQMRKMSEENPAGNAIASATIDKVSVSYSVNQSGNSSNDWLNLSPYGKELLALIAKHCGGVRYIGGYPERSGFRIVKGRFPRG